MEITKTERVEKYYVCDDCGCVVEDLNEPNVIDIGNIIQHGCKECLKIVPKDYDLVWIKK